MIGVWLANAFKEAAADMNEGQLSDEDLAQLETIDSNTSLRSSLNTALEAFALQFVLYMGITIAFDFVWTTRDAFRKSDGRVRGGKIGQEHPVNSDITEYETEVNSAPASSFNVRATDLHKAYKTSG